MINPMTFESNGDDRYLTWSTDVSVVSDAIFSAKTSAPRFTGRNDIVPESQARGSSPLYVAELKAEMLKTNTLRIDLLRAYYGGRYFEVSGVNISSGNGRGSLVFNNGRGWFWVEVSAWVDYQNRAGVEEKSVHLPAFGNGGPDMGFAEINTVPRDITKRSTGDFYRSRAKLYIQWDARGDSAVVSIGTENNENVILSGYWAPAFSEAEVNGSPSYKSDLKYIGSKKLGAYWLYDGTVSHLRVNDILTNISSSDLNRYKNKDVGETPSGWYRGVAGGEVFAPLLKNTSRPGNYQFSDEEVIKMYKSGVLGILNKSDYDSNIFPTTELKQISKWYGLTGASWYTPTGFKFNSSSEFPEVIHLALDYTDSDRVATVSGSVPSSKIAISPRASINHEFGYRSPAVLGDGIHVGVVNFEYLTGSQVTELSDGSGIFIPANWNGQTFFNRQSYVKVTFLVTISDSARQITREFDIAGKTVEKPELTTPLIQYERDVIIPINAMLPVKLNSAKDAYEHTVSTYTSMGYVASDFKQWISASGWSEKEFLGVFAKRHVIQEAFQFQEDKMISQVVDVLQDDVTAYLKKNTAHEFDLFKVTRGINQEGTVF